MISVPVVEQHIRDKRFKSLLITKPKSSARLPPSTENSELGGSSVRVQRIATTTTRNSMIRKQQRKQSMKTISKSKKMKKIRIIVPLRSL